MGTLIDLSGKKFGRLLVLTRAGSNKQKAATWHCLCDCGKKIVVPSISLLHGNTKSCRCLANDLSSLRGKRPWSTKTATYRAWSNMKQRCSNANPKDYSRYEGRGITFDERWDQYKNFLDDMGEKPTGFYLDRIDNNKGYSKENCRWVSPSKSALNKANSKTWIVLGEKFETLLDAAMFLGVTPAVIHRRCCGKRIRGKFHEPLEGYGYENKY